MLPIFHRRLERVRQRQENRGLVLYRRHLRDHSNPFDIPEERFIELYRLNKELARCIQQVTQAIETTIAIHEVTFPTSEIEHNRIKHSFMDKFGFPGVIGCVKGLLFSKYTNYL
ncbi:unnamed protein product [Acanthoscelides obtectus]|uniref:Uncharacterized protein n=1 Tax=Acanthoscelides obtectus TaxID=200917 RepID=A0A9P0LP23_ACAOB|nr:unnamed protein product [Acanthoscelides obtectus]CAK1681157.1 hypothetical protein AOBTE_LOCUS33039 [Acanthoscelides obtectus]